MLAGLDCFAIPWLAVKVRNHIAVALLIFAFSAVAEPLERSVSPSQQFVIYGGDGLSRGAISALAEKTKRDLLALLRRSDDWKIPIVLHLQSAAANVPEMPPAELHFSQTGFGLKLQLDLTLGPRWNREAIEREMIRAVLLEMIYRNQPSLPAGTAYVQPPGWLLDGLLASAPGRDRRSLIDALVSANKTISLEEFLRQQPEQLDSPARELYRAYSFALVQLLLKRENGRALGRYIDNLPQASNDTLGDLARQFSELAGSNAEQVWRSEIDQVKIEHENQLLSFAESDRRLQQILNPQSSGHRENNDDSPLPALAKRKIAPSERPTLVQLKLDLLLLAAHANPILRSTIEDYKQIAEALLAGKRRGITARLGRIEALHAEIVARMSEIDDYMNWFEATQSNTNSGLFGDYIAAAEEQGRTRSHRHDPLSIYLDALEESY